MTGELKVTLSSGSAVLDTQILPVTQSGVADLTVPFRKPLPAGFYKVAAVYSEGSEFRTFYQNGFWVREAGAVHAGPVLATHGDFITRDSAPFFPVGTNYFSTESNGWDFSGPRNAWIWDRDFAEMEQHGVSFVRTGVWMPNGALLRTTRAAARTSGSCAILNRFCCARSAITLR
jgi:hypothetical protein